MALSIARIFPPGHIRRYTIAMAIGFGTIGLGLILQLSIVCGINTEWHQVPGAHCHGIQWASSFSGQSLVIAAVRHLSIFSAYCVQVI